MIIISEQFRLCSAVEDFHLFLSEYVRRSGSLRTNKRKKLQIYEIIIIIKTTLDKVYRGIVTISADQNEDKEKNVCH